MDGNKDYAVLICGDSHHYYDGHSSSNLAVGCSHICQYSLALTIILVAMNTNEPLQFSIFPSLLLLTTLFRLGLNVSTTRSILTNADAGK